MVVHRHHWALRIYSTLGSSPTSSVLQPALVDHLTVYHKMTAAQAREAASLLKLGLPVQIPYPGDRWRHPPLAFTTADGEQGTNQALLLDAIRALAEAGRRAEAAAWYAAEFETSLEYGQRAVSLAVRV
jgi:hypothetical protein